MFTNGSFSHVYIFDRWHIILIEYFFFFKYIFTTSVGRRVPYYLVWLLIHCSGIRIVWLEAPNFLKAEHWLIRNLFCHTSRKYLAGVSSCVTLAGDVWWKSCMQLRLLLQGSTLKAKQDSQNKGGIPFSAKVSNPGRDESWFHRYTNT